MGYDEGDPHFRPGVGFVATPYVWGDTMEELHRNMDKWKKNNLGPNGVILKAYRSGEAWYRPGSPFGDWDKGEAGWMIDRCVKPVLNVELIGPPKFVSDKWCQYIRVSVVEGDPEEIQLWADAKRIGQEQAAARALEDKEEVKCGNCKIKKPREEMWNCPECNDWICLETDEDTFHSGCKIHNSYNGFSQVSVCIDCCVGYESGYVGSYYCRTCAEEYCDDCDEEWVDCECEDDDDQEDDIDMSGFFHISDDEIAELRKKFGCGD